MRVPGRGVKSPTNKNININEAIVQSRSECGSFVDSTDTFHRQLNNKKSNVIGINEKPKRSLNSLGCLNRKCDDTEITKSRIEGEETRGKIITVPSSRRLFIRTAKRLEARSPLKKNEEIEDSKRNFLDFSNFPELTYFFILIWKSRQTGIPSLCSSENKTVLRVVTCCG